MASFIVILNRVCYFSKIASRSVLSDSHKTTFKRQTTLRADYMDRIVPAACTGLSRLNRLKKLIN